MRPRPKWRRSHGGGGKLSGVNVTQFQRDCLNVLDNEHPRVIEGKRVPVYETTTEHGHEVQVFKGWEQTVPGTMTPLQYDQAMGDLVGYLQWMAEPAQNTRVRVGVWVLLFLCVMTLFAWRLNAAFWKDVK